MTEQTAERLAQKSGPERFENSDFPKINSVTKIKNTFRDFFCCFKIYPDQALFSSVTTTY